MPLLAPQLLPYRALPDVTEDDIMLDDEYIADIIHYWHTTAAEGNFNPDIHIVDPLVHHAYLASLERTVVHYSEFFRRSGDYYLDDSFYTTHSELGRRYFPNPIQDELWERVSALFDGCASNPDELEVNRRALQVGTTSLRKSHTLLCNTIGMLAHLRAWYFSTEFYSILTKDPILNVARLTQISRKQLDALEGGIKMSINRIAAGGTTFLAIESALVEVIAPELATLQADIGLTIATRDDTDLPTILATLKMIVLVLDLALVSYVGSHGTPFHSMYGITDNNDILIPSNADNIRSVLVTQQSLACLDGFVGHTQVWTFQAVISNMTAPRSRTKTDPHQLQVLTRIETFADVWGPV
jgi:hypothetical protein